MQLRRRRELNIACLSCLWQGRTRFDEEEEEEEEDDESRDGEGDPCPNCGHTYR